MPHPDMKANNGHPDEGLLHEWLDDQLSPTDAAEMQGHIAGCAACGARVAEARGLIAASRRILSALDEVPSGVIPANFGATDSAQSNVADAEVSTSHPNSDANGVVSIDAARKSKHVTESKRAFRWRRAASIAALLLVAVTVVRFGAMGDDVTVPVTSVANEASRATSDSATPAVGAARVADAREAAPPAEAPRTLAARKSAAPAGDAAVQQAKAATTSKPEQVASENSDTRASASTAAKKLPETVVADAAVVAAAPPAGAGGGRGGARRAAEPPPIVANAAASGTVSNAPPAGATTANALQSRVEFTTPPTSPSIEARLRREAEAAQRTLAQGQVQGATNRADATTARSTLQLRGAGSNAGAAASTAAAFDSVTLERTECSPACESTSLHVNALGVVRYVVRAGNTQSEVKSQLSPLERAQLQTVMIESFPSPVLQRGRTICSSPPATSERSDLRGTAPDVQLLLDMPGTSTLRREQRCAKSETELRDIAARVDAIARTDALKRRVPPRE